MTLLKEMGYDQMKGKNVKLIDPVQYGDDWVEYTYVCVDGYNEIWTYRMEGGCWEAYTETQYNVLCD